MKDSVRCQSNCRLGNSRSQLVMCTLLRQTHSDYKNSFKVENSSNIYALNYIKRCHLTNSQNSHNKCIKQRSFPKTAWPARSAQKCATREVNKHFSIIASCAAAAIAACDVTAPSAAAAVQLSDHVWCTRMRANHRHRESWDCIVTMMSNDHNDPEGVITQLRQQRDSAKRSCSSPGTTTSLTAASRAGRWWQPASTCKTTNAHSDAYT